MTRESLACRLGFYIEVGGTGSSAFMPIYQASLVTPKGEHFGEYINL